SEQALCSGISSKPRWNPARTKNGDIMSAIHPGRPTVARVVCLAVVLVLAGCGGHRDGTAAPATAGVACEQLAALAVPASAIGLPTSGATVTAAKTVAASGAGAAQLPEYCAVTGQIAPVDQSAPDIRFEVALPTQWNRKVVMFGGGGFDGSIPDV